MYEKSNMETYLIKYKIDNLQELAVWLRNLKQGQCINLEGWDGEGDGRELQKGGDMYTYGWFMLRFDKKKKKFCKAITLQLENK